MNNRSKIRGFTLIELLIVVAIIAILAAIAVPNFLEAQVRSKVARVQADMRSLTTAIESYQIDNGQPPIRRSNYSGTGGQTTWPKANTRIFDPENTNARVGLRTLTTPITYFSSIPTDVFNTPAKQKMGQPGYTDSLDYIDNVQLQTLIRITANYPSLEAVGEKGYMLFSVGPDLYAGLSQPDSTWPETSSANGNLLNTYRYFYDPTNGTFSTGNIYKFSAGLSQKEFSGPR